ncbi:ThuA domain-containing protein [Prosthecobacter sp. SYSU 5D2]|uniref:ThuA domain-containing protein n=1 Tax=Prosthecobacter sp. SYSU 5D2 TaxID=3134134 RepID=UPI0031FEB465
MKFLLLTFALALTTCLSAADKKVIVMIAGKPSHGPGQHEHAAGILLLKKSLEQTQLDQLDIRTYLNGAWPSAEDLGQAASVVIYADGGPRHPALQGDRLQQLDKEMKRGCGFLTLHYAVEPTIELGGKEFIDWMGGCFEINWSVNPHWDASFTEFPAHPITSGVKPFGTNDEWYFYMRFRKGMDRVTPILSAVAPDSTMERPDGHHSGNPTVRESVKNKEKQHVAWAAERDGGGRGFGFTGGHFHQSWSNNEQRKLVLNAILWTAQADVPEQGVESTVTEADMTANLDLKPGQGLPEKAAKKKKK